MKKRDMKLLIELLAMEVRKQAGRAEVYRFQRETHRNSAADAKKTIQELRAQIEKEAAQ